MSDNPMVLLNRAIAVAMVHGPAAGLNLVNAPDIEGRLAGHHRLDAVRAHLREMAGDLAGAVKRYRIAAERTTSPAGEELSPASGCTAGGVSVAVK